MKLLIVESPAKAKTISKYLDDAYTVRASVGHVRDLPKSNNEAIDVLGGFIPRYEIVKGKEAVIKDLKKLAAKADEIVLATDPDREGEAIAWHLIQALGLEKTKKHDVNPKVERIVFHEITKEAVQEAMRHPRAIDEPLRRAQEARRVLDRLVGYDLSGLIWKKVRYGLSAGRVQSPALRIIMEREREIRAFLPETYFVITAATKTKEGAELELTCVEEPHERAEADRIVKAAESGAWTVKDVKETEAQRAPRPPFTTSTLQQSASSRFGYSPSNTMRIAQRLYEAGHITYMRTDSLNLSASARADIAKVVLQMFGPEYGHSHAFKTRSKNAQEAHEAIRPTSVMKRAQGLTADEKKLYDLIWRRTVASQMASATVLRTRVTATVQSGGIPEFVANGSRTLFPGWLAADPAAKGEDVELPKLSKGEELVLVSIEAEDRATTPPPRYTEAGLVKELEKRGIGRPSTYASILKTLRDRHYVEREGRTLVPTDTGDVVSSFLETHFARYVSDDFTAEMENELDEIASGSREYERTLRDFYGPFSKEVKSKDSLAKATNLGEAPEEFPCPKCNASMVFKLSKNGKFMSCSLFPACDGARTAQGAELAAPKKTGEACPKCAKGELMERDGRYGRFIACSRYPKCKFIKEDPEAVKRRSTGIHCPICKEGEMVERRGKFGLFYSCSRYPECAHAIKAKPTGGVCAACGALMMEGTKTIPERCSSKACPLHNPHKHSKEPATVTETKR